MHRIETTQFGPLEYHASDVYRFPLGLPGFEDRQTFVLVERAEFSPIVFLQSTEEGSLRFPCAPIHLIDPDFLPVPSEPEAAILGTGSPWAVLGILTFTEHDSPTVNLLAPVVLNPQTHTGIQSIQPESPYTAAHRLHGPAVEEAACS